MFLSKDVETLIRAFIVYVRPTLEYASCVWSPYRITDINRIESVQRKFTKRLPGFALLNYKERLLQLKMETLESRRLRQDLLLAYKILFGLVDTNPQDFFTIANSGHDTRGHKYKLLTSHSRFDVRKYFFSERVISVWNNLVAIEADFANLQAFKHFIAKLYDLYHWKCGARES
jgi:hypothetical protein